MHSEWAKMYAQHLFTDEPCYQRQVFNAYRQMGEEEPSMKPYLLGVGVFGFPVPPHGFNFVYVDEGRPPAVRMTVLTNAPNPFNPSTTIHYALPERREVHLRIFDISGRCVAALVEGKTEEAGTHEVRWDGHNEEGRAVGSGVYLARLEAGRESKITKMVLLK